MRPFSTTRYSRPSRAATAAAESPAGPEPMMSRSSRTPPVRMTRTSSHARELIINSARLGVALRRLVAFAVSPFTGLGARPFFGQRLRALVRQLAQPAAEPLQEVFKILAPVFAVSALLMHPVACFGDDAPDVEVFDALAAKLVHDEGAEGAVALELRLVEELVGGGLVREGRVALLIFEHVARLAAIDGGLDV